MAQGAEMDKDPDTAPERLPNVIVKFHNWVELPYQDNLQEYLVENKLAPWAELEHEFPGISIQRVYITLSPEEIQDFEDQAFEREDPERPHLLQYFQIDAPPGTDREALAKMIRGWDIVELAYVPLTLVSPPDPPSHPAAAQNSQVHLGVAPASIGAEAAWRTASADGRGMKFIDLERGWVLNHQNFLNSNGSSIFSVVDPATSQLSTDSHALSHGASVLGTVAAPDFGGTKMQTIGIAFKASGRVISIDRIPAGGGSVKENIYDAISVASAALSQGDVILIEAQAVDSARKLWPVEANKLEYEMIRTATQPNNNRVVIEAAGNGTDITPPNGTQGNNLNLFISDQFPGPALHIFDRTKPTEFKDSGAIMVGAATSTMPHSRMARTNDNSESNFGNRVDCFAWGQNIFTTGGPNATSYDLHFGSTSGASAIIASAALIVQGLAKAHQKGDNPTNRTYRPATLRKILGSFDPNTQQPWRRPAPDDVPPFGTKSNNPAADLIGVMPDLVKIIDKHMALGPDLFLRDFLGDPGTPHAGLIGTSPDIIAQNSAVSNYEGTFGQTSPKRNMDGLGETIKKNGSPKYVYVRVIDRGCTDAENVVVTLYWSEVATLLTPNMWTQIGSSILPLVPMQEMRVAQIAWQNSAIPHAGHYCFVAVAGNSRDPAPTNLANFQTWNDYHNYIRQFNNVTWCNFNVTEMSASGIGSGGGAGEPDPENGGSADRAGMTVLPFLVTGAQFEDLPMQLDITAQLPERARLWLEGSEGFLKAINEGRPVQLEDTREHGIKRVSVNPFGNDRFSNILFAKDLRENMKLVVDVPAEARQQNYDLFLRQLHQNEEVGRITWRLVPPAATPNRGSFCMILRQFLSRLVPVLRYLLILLVPLTLIYRFLKRYRARR